MSSSEISRIQRIYRTSRLLLNLEKPIDHSERRYTQLSQTFLTSLLGRGLMILVGFISLPLTVQYLGAEKYGIWVTISTFLTWLTIFDFGIGNGLINKLSEAYSFGDVKKAQSYIATALATMSGISILLGIGFSVGLSYINWHELLNVSGQVNPNEVSISISFAIICFLLNFPLSIFQKILLAYQEGVISNYWNIAGSVSSLLALIWVTRTQSGLIWLVMALGVTQLVVSAICGIWIFIRHKPELRPSMRSVRYDMLNSMARHSGLFFVIQIAALVLFQTDNLIIAKYIGVQNVTDYSVAYKLFSYIPMLQALYLTPLWPAYAEATAKRDWGWIKKTLLRSIKITIFAGFPASLALAFIAQPFIHFWTSGQIVPDRMVIWMLAAWTCMGLWGACFAYMMNGLGEIKNQALFASLMAIINLVLSITLVQDYGVTGVIAGTLISYGLISVTVSPIDAFITLKRLSLRNDHT